MTDGTRGGTSEQVGRAPEEPARLVTMCTHNRTRSVAMAGMISADLSARGIRARIASAGQREAGQPATSATVRMLSGLGIDVSTHRSRTISGELVQAADLILTAERKHVVYVAGSWPGAFDKTFTLPEFVDQAEWIGPRAGRPMREWLTLFRADRPRGADYLRAEEIGEIADPTGESDVEWQRCFTRIGGLCHRLSGVL